MGLRFRIPASIVTAVLTATALQFCACRGTASGVSPYPLFVDLPRDERVMGIPVIVVGRVLSSERMKKAIESPWGDHHNYELHRGRIGVETVLAGTISSQTLDFLFYRATDPVGQALLGTVVDGGSWRVGQREMLFLQLDHGHLRTVCDTYAHCAVQVSSGSHAEPFAPSIPMGRRIVDVLLTRGGNVTDEAFAQGLVHASSDAYDFDRVHTMEVLQRIAAASNPGIRNAALAALQNLHR
jgi:hypothetical protein